MFIVFLLCVGVGLIVAAGVLWLLLRLFNLSFMSLLGNSSSSKAGELHNRGIEAFQAGNVYGAIRLFEKAVEIDSTEPLFHSSLCDAYLQAEEFDRAVECANYALSLNSRSVEGLKSLGLCKFRMGDIIEAKELLLSAVSIKSRFYQAHFVLAHVYCEIGDYESAYQEYYFIERGGEYTTARLNPLLHKIMDVEGRQKGNSRRQSDSESSNEAFGNESENGKKKPVVEDHSLDMYAQILGVEVNATSIEIKSAYRDLVKVWHPDRFGGDDRLKRKAEEQMKLINEAYSVLGK